MPDPTDHAVKLFNQATEFRAQGDLERAEEFCAQAIEIFQTAEGENSPDAANLLNVLASIRDERGDYEGAINAAKRATNILDTLGENFSGDDAAHIRLEAWSRLGNLQRHLARYSEAEENLKRALALALESFGEASDEASNARNNLGILYKYTGKFDDAKILYETALANIEREYGREHISTASLYHNLGGLEHARGDFAAGEEPARKAWEIRANALGSHHPDALADAVAYAGVLDGLERYDESEKIYRDVLVEYEKIYPRRTLRNRRSVPQSRQRAFCARRLRRSGNVDAAHARHQTKIIRRRTSRHCALNEQSRRSLASARKK